MEWTAFAKLLKSAHLCNVKMCILNMPRVVQLDRDLGMAFDAGNRIDNDLLRHWIILYLPNRVRLLRSGV